jgi:hypothetical protein
MKGSAALLVAALVAPLGCSFDGAGVDGGAGDGDAGIDADRSPRTVALSRDDGDAVTDTWILEGEPNDAHGLTPTLVIDESRGSDGRAVALLFFDLVGDGPRQVPEGASVTAATLGLTIGPVLVGGGEPGGDEVTLCAALRDWSETETWTSFGGDPEPDTHFVPDGCAAAPETVGQEIGFSFEVDVTAAVQLWVAADLVNRGWLLTGGTDGVNFYASDETDSDGQPVSFKPTLTIEFTPP